MIAEVLAELGVLGLCIYLFFMGYRGQGCDSSDETSRSSVIERGVTGAAVAILFFEFILTFKEGSFLTHTFTFGWALIISRMAALKMTERDKRGQRPGNAGTRNTGQHRCRPRLRRAWVRPIDRWGRRPTAHDTGRHAAEGPGVMSEETNCSKSRRRRIRRGRTGVRFSPKWSNILNRGRK